MFLLYLVCSISTTLAKENEVSALHLHFGVSDCNGTHFGCYSSENKDLLSDSKEEVSRMVPLKLCSSKKLSSRMTGVDCLGKEQDYLWSLSLS